MVVTGIIEKPGGALVGRITFDRAEKKNALTPEMLESVVGAVKDFGGAEETVTGKMPVGRTGRMPVPRVGAIVLEGNCAAFCSGLDLSLCRENSEALGELLRGLSGAIRALRRC